MLTANHEDISDGGNGFASNETARQIAALSAGELSEYGELNGSGFVRDLPTHCRARMDASIETMKQVFVDKDEIIKLCAASLLARTPMILLGPPGTAKSAVVRVFCTLLGLRPKHWDFGTFEEDLKASLRGQDSTNIRIGDRPLFEYLVTRFTTPEEILGTANIDALLNLSIYYRETEGMLPSSQIAFLDEIFKANSAILNSLLSIVNERLFYNAGRPFKVNLLTVFGASNEIPDSDELAALFDRFPIRVISDNVADEQVEKMVEKSVMDADAQVKGGDGVIARKTACLNDYRLLGRLLPVVYPWNPDGEFERHFVSLFKSLRLEFGISDRTANRLIMVARALSFVNGEYTLSPKSLNVFKYCFAEMDHAKVLEDIVKTTIATI
ncbi:MAG: AAA family ATPase [Pirellulaceae bacterium]